MHGLAKSAYKDKGISNGFKNFTERAKSKSKKGFGTAEISDAKEAS